MWQVLIIKDPRAILHHQPAPNPLPIGQTSLAQRQNSSKIRAVHQRLVNCEQLHRVKQSIHPKGKHSHID